MYPLIDLLERVVLRFEREESSDQKRRKLGGFVVQYGLPLAEVCQEEMARRGRESLPPGCCLEVADSRRRATLPEHPSHITVAGQSCLILHGEASRALSKSSLPVRL